MCQLSCVLAVWPQWVPGPLDLGNSLRTWLWRLFMLLRGASRLKANHRLEPGLRQTWIPEIALMLRSCVSLETLSTFSGPWLLICKMGWRGLLYWHHGKMMSFVLHVWHSWVRIGKMPANAISIRIRPPLSGTVGALHNFFFYFILWFLFRWSFHVFCINRAVWIPCWVILTLIFWSSFWVDEAVGWLSGEVIVCVCVYFLLTYLNDSTLQWLCWSFSSSFQKGDVWVAEEEEE